jgi:hypothetical protein
MTTEPKPVHHLADVRELRPPPAEVDVDTIAGHLVTLIDLGRAITARNAVAVIPDLELEAAGQRVEHLAAVLFRTLFDAPPPAPRR